MYEPSAGSTYLGGKSVVVNGLIVAGMGGSMWYNGGDNQYSDRAMFYKLLLMIPRLLLNKARYGRYLDVLVTHAPPRGIH